MMNPTTGKKNSKGDHAKKVEGTYIVGHKHQTGHYMEKMPWFKTAKRYRPNNMKDQSRQTIDRFLSLEHVYGFNGQSTRNNLIYTGEGLDYVFTSASLGIVVDPSQEIGKQRYMSGHTDDIISIATFQIKKKRAGFSFVATGEIGRHPKIIVWKSDTMEVLQTLKNVHLKGIAQLAFSPSGSLLASIGLDVHNTLVIHNWKKGIEITRCATGENRVFGLSFQPDIALHLDDSRLVTCGKKHLKFWNRNPNGKNYRSRPAKFGKLGGKVSIVDVCFDFAGRCVSASNLGHLLIFPPKDNDSNMLPLNKGSIKNAHDGPINCVVTVSGGNKIVSGGVDGMIKVWLCPNDLHHQIKSYRSFDTILKIERIPSIQSISISGNKVRALIGTRGGDVLEMKISDGSLIKKKPLTTGHYHGELWGLAAHPTNPKLFATCGDDKTVRMWKINDHSCIAITDPGSIPEICRAICFTPAPGHEGEYLAIGTGGVTIDHTHEHNEHAGKVLILDGENLEVLNTIKVADSMISDLCFTSDGRKLAAACYDTFIYLLDVEGPTQIKLYTKCIGHKNYVTNITLSNDTFYMLSNGGGGEMKYWNLEDGTEEKNVGAICQADWSGRNTCPLSWSTQGIWPKSHGKLTDINSIYEKDGIIITGDDFGMVNLYNSPSMTWTAPHVLHNGHSAHVTKVCINADNSRVISIGGADRCAFVWKVVQSEDVETKT